MRIIKTNELTPESIEGLGESVKLWVYNGLDCCVTDEVLEAMLPGADNVTRNTYNFSLTLQAPIFEMGLRGLLVDQDRRAEVLRSYEADIAQVEAQLDEIIRDGVGTEINWRSPKQLMELLYDIMGLPPIRKRNTKGQMVPTVNREALEKLAVHFLAQPIISHLLLLRDIGKKVGVLQTEIDPDGRMRTSFNIAGTTTGRLASSASEFGTGTNLQNIEKKLRTVFIADPGMKIANIDLAQGDSRNVGAICWNLFVESHGEAYAGAYLDACESGDLHTTVTKMVWPHLPWTGDPKKDKELAEEKFYRMYSYRDMSKKGGHGTNYIGQPATMARHMKMPTATVADFQKSYFAGFPCIRKWHDQVTSQLFTTGQLTTMFGRRRYFFGRRNDASTIREAVAYEPQSMTADEINTGMIELWRLGICELLLQVHDSLVVQYPEELEDEIVPVILRTVERSLILARDRKFTISCDAQVGWNLGMYGEDNPDGLRGYNPGDKGRKRFRQPVTSILDRRVF